MPCLRLDLAKTFPPETKRELTKRLCELGRSLGRPEAARAELGLLPQCQARVGLEADQGNYPTGMKRPGR
jgi:hypothetical protein